MFVKIYLFCILKLLCERKTVNNIHAAAVPAAAFGSVKDKKPHSTGTSGFSTAMALLQVNNEQILMKVFKTDWTFNHEIPNQVGMKLA